MEERPYIGVSAVMHRSDASALLALMPEDSEHLLMIGTVASLKTLRGQTNSLPHRFVLMEDMADVFVKHPLALNLIHYASEEPETLDEQLTKLVEYGGPNLHGFQLNIVWPDIDALGRFISEYPEMTMIMQVSGRTLEAVGNDMDRLVERLGNYSGLIDRLLLDMSRGYGVAIDPAKMRPLLETLVPRSANLHMKIGFAGGLGPDLLDPARAILADFPDTSFDAEGKLRDSDDHLSLVRASSYVIESLGIV